MTATQQIIKRFFDIFFIVILAPAVIPVCLVLALIIKVTDLKAPILFSQVRVGKNGKLFKMLKFRSMIAGDHTLVTPRNEDGSLKISVDDKTTPIGRFMRRLSLDELPQLINVVLGDMSLIGPRPELLFHAEEYDKQTYQRLKVKPGLTGLAQVQGRNELNLDQRHELDIEYVNKYSFLLDIKIIYMTLLVIFSGAGVYRENKVLTKHSKVNHN